MGFGPHGCLLSRWVSCFGSRVWDTISSFAAVPVPVTTAPTTTAAPTRGNKAGSSGGGGIAGVHEQHQRQQQQQQEEEDEEEEEEEEDEEKEEEKEEEEQENRSTMVFDAVCRWISNSSTSKMCGWQICIDLGYKHRELYDENEHEYIGGMLDGEGALGGLQIVFPSLRDGHQTPNDLLRGLRDRMQSRMRMQVRCVYNESATYNHA